MPYRPTEEHIVSMIDSIKLDSKLIKFEKCTDDELNLLLWKLCQVSECFHKLINRKKTTHDN